MIVCHCKGVTERQIRKAIRNGAMCRNDVIGSCTAGSKCGGCTPMIDQIIETERDQQNPLSLLSLSEATVG